MLCGPQACGRDLGGVAAFAKPGIAKKLGSGREALGGGREALGTTGGE